MEALTVKQLVNTAHTTARNKGFWPTGESGKVGTFNVSEKLMLVVSEIAEAQEELRTGFSTLDDYQSESGKPEGFGIELADAVIRIADLCGALGIDLEGAIRRKLDYNATRPHKHGKAF